MVPALPMEVVGIARMATTAQVPSCAFQVHHGTEVVSHCHLCMYSPVGYGEACWGVFWQCERDSGHVQVACMAGTTAPHWEGGMGHLLIKEAWAGMAAHMELAIHTELGAMAAACMGGRWAPWGRTGVTALAWGAAMDPATGPACTGGLMAATTATALGLGVVTWVRLTEQAPCQVHLVGPFGPHHPCSAASGQVFVHHVLP